MTNKTYSVCTITENKQIAEEIFDMTIKCGEIADKARPGQFAMLYPKSGALLLPRPISICYADAKTQTLRFVYKIAGKGTHEFSEYKSGDAIRVLAPLGNGYPIFPAQKKIAIVGGGVGIPPLVYLTEKCLHPANDVHVFLGFRDEPFLLGDFGGANVDFAVNGKPIDLKAVAEGSFDVVYGCGPKVMLKILAEQTAKNDVCCYVSVEERMACGVGVCVGCVCGKTDGSYKKVCTDGPVFKACEIFWD